MAKKDDDLIAKLVDIIERNTKAYELFAQAINNQVESDNKYVGTEEVTEGEVVEDHASAGDAVPDPEVKTEVKAPVITLEQCREVVMEMDEKGKNRDAVVIFLSKFNAKNMKEVKEADYPDFFSRGKVINDMKKKNDAEKPPENDPLI